MENGNILTVSNSTTATNITEINITTVTSITTLTNIVIATLHSLVTAKSYKGWSSQLKYCFNYATSSQTSVQRRIRKSVSCGSSFFECTTNIPRGLSASINQRNLWSIAFI